MIINCSFVWDFRSNVDLIVFSNPRFSQSSHISNPVFSSKPSQATLSSSFPTTEKTPANHLDREYIYPTPLRLHSVYALNKLYHLSIYSPSPIDPRDREHRGARTSRLDIYCARRERGERETMSPRVRRCADKKLGRMSRGDFFLSPRARVWKFGSARGFVLRCAYSEIYRGGGGRSGLRKIRALYKVFKW